MDDDLKHDQLKVGTAEILGGTAAAVAVGSAAAIVAGESALRPLTTENVTKEMTPIFNKGVENAKQAGLEYIKHNPPPSDAEGLKAWKQAFVKRFSGAPEGTKLGASFETLAEKAALAEHYRQASYLDKPMIAFRAAPASIKVAILGVAGLGAIGAGYLISNRRKPQSFVEKITLERSETHSDERSI